jgi:hypothetical protein
MQQCNVTKKGNELILGSAFISYFAERCFLRIELWETTKKFTGNGFNATL